MRYFEKQSRLVDEFVKTMEEHSGLLEKAEKDINEAHMKLAEPAGKFHTNGLFDKVDAIKSNHKSIYDSAEKLNGMNDKLYETKYTDKQHPDLFKVGNDTVLAHDHYHDSYKRFKKAFDDRMRPFGGGSSLN